LLSNSLSPSKAYYNFKFNPIMRSFGSKRSIALTTV